MASCILYLQTPLECLKKSYPSTHLVSEVPFTSAIIHRRPGNTLLLWMLLSERTDPIFPSAIFRGESVNEEFNNTFEFIEPTPSTVSGIDPHPIILPTNKVPWKTYYRRNLRKEVVSPISQPSAPVQDSEPPRDQGMENPTEPCINNIMNENDRSDVVVLENVEEKNSGDETVFKAFTASLDSTTIPKNIHNCLECPKWKNVVMEEMKGFEKNNTWKICALPKGHKLVGCKWVFTLKCKVDGTLDRHTTRVLLSVVVNIDWPLYELDVKNAFLNRGLVEEVYMSPLPSFEAQIHYLCQVLRIQSGTL
ncbi:reverse transcriptase [Cucumis melo var. makuwa]|uniref:Reverse transcriptase n=1 Tax=Cucumis melo var. makuwa TaxID=1194695 RepID=A0A5A7STP7_CUCMM|nr:reverse transcriptase [Cucumis melo var. makuwa]